MATSTISNTITDLNGTPLEGVTIEVELKPGPGFRISDSSEVSSSDETTTDSNGDWSIALERNTNIDPTGSYYEVRELIDDTDGGPRVWSIQVGASNQTLRASLVSEPPASSGPSYLTQGSADARYQALDSLGASTPLVRSQANATAGVASSALRSDAVPYLHAETGGNGIDVTAGVISVNTDDASIEKSGDAVRQKDNGTTFAKLAADARGAVHHSLFREGVT